MAFDGYGIRCNACLTGIRFGFSFGFCFCFGLSGQLVDDVFAIGIFATAVKDSPTGCLLNQFAIAAVQDARKAHGVGLDEFAVRVTGAGEET